MKKKVLITAIIVIPLIIAGYYILRKDKTFVIEWETKAVERGDINIEITATGTLEAVTEVEVGTQVSGILSELYVDFNSKVKKGQVIARLDTTTLAAQVFDSRANLERKQILLNQAERDWKRTQQLFEEKDLHRIWILRKVLSQLSEVEAMELLHDKIVRHKTNSDFLDAMTKG